MQKKLVQTRLPSSFSKSESSIEGKPSLKRKSSDTETMATPKKMTYSDAASSNRDHSHQDNWRHYKPGQGKSPNRGTSSPHGQAQESQWPILKPNSSGPPSVSERNPAWGAKGANSFAHGQQSDARTSSATSKDMDVDAQTEYHSSSEGYSSTSTFTVKPHDVPLPSSTSRKVSPTSPDPMSSSQRSNDGSDSDEDDADVRDFGSKGGHWKGKPVKELKRAPKCYEGQRLPELKSTHDHKVFFRVPRDGHYDKVLEPFPEKFEDRWDESYVYMPCSWSNKMPDPTESSGTSHRWKVIKSALGKRIVDSFSLQDAILSYNSHYKRRWNFDALHEYFNKKLHPKEKDKFFVETLPEIQRLALRLPDLCTKRIPILRQGSNMKLTFSQEQIACLLANAFFCTFPKRNARVRGNRLPDINFSNLFSDSRDRTPRKIEKFKCLFNYFERVTTEMPTGTVSYARQFVDYRSMPDWHNVGKQFGELHVATSGTIEDDGQGMLQADFANKYVGGGVLGNGLVQEEIRFVLCPEMILSRLFTEVLQDSEVLIMTGCERFNDYEGYGDTFRFTKNYDDDTERDDWGRKFTEVVAMDALVVRNHPSAQFEWGQVRRELSKAYCAFKGNEFKENLPAVRTGNWGCGAFGGDKQLKALIQMMAASVVGRDVVYFTFGDHELCNDLAAVHKILKEEGVKIRSACTLIEDYRSRVMKSYYSSGKKQSLFKFIAMMLGREGLRNSSSSSSDDFDDKGQQYGSLDFQGNSP